MSVYTKLIMKFYVPLMLGECNGGGKSGKISKFVPLVWVWSGIFFRLKLAFFELPIGSV